MRPPDSPEPAPPAANTAAPALSPQLELLQQRALAAYTPTAVPATGGDEFPGWVVAVPRIVIGCTALTVAGCAAIAAARWSSPNELPGPAAVFAFVVVFQLSMTIPGLAMLMAPLRAMAAASLFTRKVPGVIKGFASLAVPGDGTWLESPGVEYAYEVNGQLYHASTSAEFSSNSEGMNRRYRASLPQPGSVVTVCCHPDHPERSMVADCEPSLGIGGICGACLILFGFLAPLWDLIDFVVRPP